MKPLILASVLIWSCVASAQDIIVIGEVHDNPAHHQFQFEKISALNPAALVLEMITSEQADSIPSDIRASPEELGKKLNWDQSGWPDFAMYASIFIAAPRARLYGALVPAPGNARMRTPELEAYLDLLSQIYELDRPLPPDMQQAREALQMAAHCDALPESVLPAMVNFQRLRDASLADAAIRAFRETGGPVVVITGNGHARRDWGMPALLVEKAPEIEVHVIGQTEDGQEMGGGFDEVLSAPAVDRPDPCLAFQ